MKIAVVHYHLRGGGVSRVIQLATQSLPDNHFAILIGEPSAIPHTIVEGLGYGHDTRPDILAHRLREAARRSLHGEPDIWHVHNHSLAKNAALPGALKVLASSGARLLLQLHDFADDGREENLLGMTLEQRNAYLKAVYPCGIHYATINQRDRSLLIRAGASHVHYLPNPVDPSLRPLPLPSAGHNRWLWSARPIRRKNIGELLLWAMRMRGEIRFITCAAPADQQSIRLIEYWQSISARLKLPIDWSRSPLNFAAYERTCGECSAVLTTSIAEGFGMNFIEPWVQNRPLVGRNLPEITRDLEGLDLSHMDDAIRIPPDLLDQSHDIDFGLLNEEQQTHVLTRIAGSRQLQSEIFPNEFHLPDPDCIHRNAEYVQANLSLEKYGSRLSAIYDQVASHDQDPSGQLDRDVILNFFNDPSRLQPLRHAPFLACVA